MFGTFRRQAGAWLRLCITLPSLLAACGGGGSSAPVDTAPPPVAHVSSLGDFPDPFLLQEGGTTYAFATNSVGRNVQVAASTDRVSWQAQADAMPQLPVWARPGFGFVWAPEVLKLGNRYLLYFTAHDQASDRQCVGVAEAQQPQGPYVDSRNAPLVCQVAEGGSIDASPLQVGDQLYLYFKNDGNCCAMPTSLYAQRLSADGLAVQGDPVRLLTNQAAWEGAVIEAPTMWVHEGTYHLFYSGGNYADTSYAVGHAVCAGPLGPCERAAANPVLKSRQDTTPPLVGPGHAGLLQVGDQTWIAYHAWEVTATGARGNRRFMYLDKLDWVNGTPVVGGPTMVP
ncbi:glycoside hydrolase family 43 protein [Ideonella sp. BN130291]|uniref:glycoside hydrolase family 43 protein n=1 Tax=Ideonella sp. BN130291 TaxID=3112940 RepID=UPI002E25C769|nr:glycoside hydrolase family 43 protein [Ideonella sp. BN130291]